MGHYHWFGRGLRLQLAISGVCTIAFILFGYDQGVFSGIVTNPDWLDLFGHPQDSFLGIIVSIYNLGAFSGCILAFLVGDYLGRRRTMWFAMCWIIVGAIIQTSSYSIAQIMVGRYITGIGTGLETSTVPMYQAELAEPHKRGRLVCSEPLFVGVGIVVSYFFDYGMSYVGGPISWRLPIACQMIFAFLAIIVLFGVPESPRWLYKKGRKDEARQILCEVYDRDPDHPKVVSEQKDILNAIEAEEAGGGFKWRTILKSDDLHTRRRVILSWLMQFMNQAGGINLVVYYIPTILEQNVGVEHQTALVLGGCIQIMFVVGSFYPAFFSDRFGRRMPMMVGSTILGICMMLVAILLSFQGTVQEKNTASASIAFFFLYMLAFGASVNCIPWVYCTEILPLHARGRGTAVGVSSNWIWNFVIVMISPIIVQRLAWKGYLIFMCTNFAFVPLVYFFFPEVANLSLEEIDSLFTNPEKNPVKVGRDLKKQIKERKGNKDEEQSVPESNHNTNTEKPDIEHIEVS